MEATQCHTCGHEESAHLESGPNGTPWCRRCYGHPFLHRRKDHGYEG